MTVKELNISASYSGATNGYEVRMAGEVVAWLPDRISADMFVAELKGKLLLHQDSK